MDNKTHFSTRMQDKTENIIFATPMTGGKNVFNNTCGISSETSFIALGCIDFRLFSRSSCVKHTSPSCRDLSFLRFAVETKRIHSIN